MTDNQDKSRAKHDYFTRLSHAGRAATHSHGFVNPPVHRGSTLLVPDVATRKASGAKRFERQLTYGVGGTPTHWPLEDVVAEIEGGTRCQIVGSGLAAVTVPLLAFLKAGDHLLMTDSTYGPTRNFCDGHLAKFGVETTYYHPNISADDLTKLFKPNTTVLFVESPGSHTFDVQDVPALAAVARAHQAKVLMDNTWGIHFFQPFTHGVDVSIQALTKYVGGHSDIILGGVTVNSEADWQILRATSSALGQFASPDDCWLALRGVRTMAVRMERQEKSALIVATWLAQQPEIHQVLYPALPGAPGHDIWKRDFTGASSLFGVVLQPNLTETHLTQLVESLDLFGIGASWGGYESLVLPTTGFLTRTANSGSFPGMVMRLHIGLEAPEDLINDLSQGFAGLRGR